MIGPEEIEQPRKSNPTPMIVLGAAGLLLLVVGFISYRDYVNSKAEERIKQSDQMVRELERKINEMENNLQAQGRLATAPTGPSPGPAVPPPDPEIEKLRRELEAMRQRQEETNRKVQQALETSTVAGGSFGPEDPVSPPPRPPDFDDEGIPDYLRDSVSAPPGGMSEAARQRQSALEQRVLGAPSLAEVTSFDPEWGFVTFNAGRSQGVTEDSRFSIRRGAELLGIVKVSQVFESESIATIVTKNLQYDGALKPRAGDEIIAWEPF